MLCKDKHCGFQVGLIMQMLSSNGPIWDTYKQYKYQLEISKYTEIYAHASNNNVALIVLNTLPHESSPYNTVWEMETPNAPLPE